MAQELYQLPEGWEWRKLGELVEILGGATPSKSRHDYWSGDIKWASVRDMQNDSISDTELRITKEGFSSCSTSIIPTDNIILVTRVGLGKVAVTRDNIAINQDLRGLLVGHEIALYFLFYWLKANASFIEASGTGATVKGVKLDFVKNFQCPVPPKKEQTRIVNKLEALLSRIDQATNTLKHSIELTDALFASSLNQAFNPLGAPLQEDGTYQLPDGWEWKKLDSLVKILGGATPSKSNSSYWLGDIKWASVRDIQGDSISDTELHITQEGFTSCSTNIVPANNIILVTRVGLGKMVVTKDDIAINQDLRGLLVGNNVELYFLFFWLKSNSKLIENSGTGATVKGVKLEFVKNFQCPVPLPEHQSSVVKTLKLIQTKIQTSKAALTAKLEQLEQLKASLLDAAFRGEL